MLENKLRFWDGWLLAVAVLLTVFGLAVAFLGQTALFAAYDRALAAAFWGGAAIPSDVAHYKAFVYGPLGGVIAGRWLLVAFVAALPFRRREAWAWWAVLASVGLWFAVDSFVSWRTGAIFNVAFNCMPALATLLPLYFTRREFRSSAAGRRALSD